MEGADTGDESDDEEDGWDGDGAGAEGGEHEPTRGAASGRAQPAAHRPEAAAQCAGAAHAVAPGAGPALEGREQPRPHRHAELAAALLAAAAAAWPSLATPLHPLLRPLTAWPLRPGSPARVLPSASLPPPSAWPPSLRACLRLPRLLAAALEPRHAPLLGPLLVALAEDELLAAAELPYAPALALAAAAELGLEVLGTEAAARLASAALAALGRSAARMAAAQQRVAAMEALAGLGCGADGGAEREGGARARRCEKAAAGGSAGAVADADGARDNGAARAQRRVRVRAAAGGERGAPGGELPPPSECPWAALAEALMRLYAPALRRCGAPPPLRNLVLGLPGRSWARPLAVAALLGLGGGVDCGPASPGEGTAALLDELHAACHGWQVRGPQLAGKAVARNGFDGMRAPSHALCACRRSSRQARAEACRAEAEALALPAEGGTAWRSLAAERAAWRAGGERLAADEGAGGAAPEREEMPALRFAAFDGAQAVPGNAAAEPLAGGASGSGAAAAGLDAPARDVAALQGLLCVAAAAVELAGGVAAAAALAADAPPDGALLAGAQLLRSAALQRPPHAGGPVAAAGAAGGPGRSVGPDGRRTRPALSAREEAIQGMQARYRVAALERDLAGDPWRGANGPQAPVEEDAASEAEAGGDSGGAAAARRRAVLGSLRRLLDRLQASGAPRAWDLGA
jgi:hypothetical protein